MDGTWFLSVVKDWLSNHDAHQVQATALYTTALRDEITARHLAAVVDAWEGRTVDLTVSWIRIQAVLRSFGYQAKATVHVANSVSLYIRQEAAGQTYFDHVVQCPIIPNPQSEAHIQIQTRDLSLAVDGLASKIATVYRKDLLTCLFGEDFFRTVCPAIALATRVRLLEEAESAGMIPSPRTNVACVDRMVNQVVREYRQMLCQLVNAQKLPPKA